MVIEINKNIDNYKESVVMGLTARQLIYSVLSVAIGGGIVLALYKNIGLTASTYIAIPVVAPIALSGFYSYNGMTFMEMVKRKLHYAFRNQTLTYISTEGETEIRQLRQAEEMTGNGTDKKKGRGQNDFSKAKKNMVLMLLAVFLLLAAFVVFAVWFKYGR